MTTGSGTANPLFVAVGLLAIVIVGMSFESLQPYVVGLLILILIGLLLNGANQIHGSFAALGGFLNNPPIAGPIINHP